MQDPLPGAPRNHPERSPLAVGSNALFEGLSPEVLEQVAPIPRTVELPAGKLIFDEGNSGDALYLVIRGSVRISTRGRGGQQETLYYVRAGDFFGEMALYVPAPRSARAIAAEDVVLGRVDQDAFEELLALAPSVIPRNVGRAITCRLREANVHFVQEILEAERLSLIGSMAGAIMHDIRNPLTAVLGVAHMLEERADDPELLRYAGLLKRSVGRMTEMTREVMDFSGGATTMSLERVRVPELLADLDEQVLHALPSGIRVERRIEYDGELLVDRGRFPRVLINIIKNAAEAMPAGGVLTLGVHRREGGVLFSVSDTGHGIPANLLPSIFEPFVTHGKASGTGLGMAIAKSVVEAHGGTITVESLPGEGARFEIRLPEPAGS